MIDLGIKFCEAHESNMASIQAAREAIWMRKILVGLFGSQMDLTVICCDNQSCIKHSTNPMFDRSKHIYPVPSSQRLCAENNHVATIHSHGRCSPGANSNIIETGSG